MTTRTHVDYAIEHAGYLATAAREMIDSVDALAMAEECREENDSQESDDAVQVAEQSVSEARRALQSAIYGFETRRDRALSGASDVFGAPKVECPKTGFSLSPGSPQTGDEGEGQSPNGVSPSHVEGISLHTPMNTEGGNHG